MTKKHILKLAITGCTGRMGQIIIKEINQRDNVDLVGALARPGNPFVGEDVGTLVGIDPFNLSITDNPLNAFKDADVIIGFSQAEGLSLHLQGALEQKKPFVVCTTGLNEDHKTALEKASTLIPLIIAPNTSLGIALLRKLSLLSAEVLGPSYDVSLLEMHHRHKRDTPSGTTVSIAQALKSVDHLKESTPPYSSQSPRPTGTIECAVLRGGGIAGDHTAIFAGEKDVFKIEHRTLDPAIFALGAIRAAQWLFGKPPGHYSMDDVLEIRS
jgi:4-hydroxy-tetrahydrodipicolinate reductase